MTVQGKYEAAKEQYAGLGVDTEKALKVLEGIKISMHCWQGDDVVGFDHEGPLTGGIQTTGNYPGKARNPKELMDDIEKVFSLVPGKHKVNLHACYAIFDEGEWADRDALLPRHFDKWIEFGRKNGIAFDFNPTFFSHPLAAEATLSSKDENVRQFWVRHGIACLKISEYLAEQQGCPCAMNIWIPDGLKDVPADRLGPRARFKQSLDEILATPYDKSKVLVCLESKVFGIGMESYTVGSSEFTINYAASKGIISLMDNGHYHPTEVVSDKISSMLLFNDKIGLHVTRSVRWDSDHVVLLDDETKEIAKEIVRNDAIDRVLLALDYFDASINRIAAWTIGMRNMQKALLYALLSPSKKLRQLQDSGMFTELMMQQEELKTYPFGAVWDEFCERCGVPIGESWYEEVKKYENEVLAKRS